MNEKQINQAAMSAEHAVSRAVDEFRAEKRKEENERRQNDREQEKQTEMVIAVTTLCKKIDDLQRQITALTTPKKGK
tara:strand:+ start:14857 stop:15087 length:231 start_codon:yes stop_codon:yes gene_type:complete